ncbi:hypothetical protein EVAR_96956_1 [Eumeta japonica]|uniref:Uncharacterized protein n=1 Tax=Eumeta variegata TaxID=151549 RepID=A0A4C1VED0_EUMVA|nr:hypothetical protein EVAR_96956_1 [Eumeta japonica]
MVSLAGPIEADDRRVSVLDAPVVEETVETASTASRPAKSKKRAPWKGKTEFSHPWLLKNLKGHPGTVLHMDFSANGKFLAATCEGKKEAVKLIYYHEEGRIGAEPVEEAPPARDLVSAFLSLSATPLLCVIWRSAGRCRDVTPHPLGDTLTVPLRAALLRLLPQSSVRSDISKPIPEANPFLPPDKTQLCIKCRYGRTARSALGRGEASTRHRPRPPAPRGARIMPKYTN